MTKSSKTRIYLTSRQKAIVKVWLDGSRWWYNKVVELYRAGFSVSEYDMRRIVRAVSPDWFAPVPSKILSGAIADAYKANQAVWRARKTGNRKAELHFRSRKCPIQSLSLCHVAWNKDRSTIYPRSLGQIRLSRPIPEVPRDGRLIVHNGRYYVTVPH